MKVKTFALFFVLLLAAGVFGQDKCLRYVESSAGFSYCPPADWTDRGAAGNPYKVYFGARSGQFSSNVNVKSEDVAVSLSDYADRSVELILASKEKLQLTAIEPTGRSDFRTASGLAGIRTAFDVEYKGILLTSIQYAFLSPKKRIFVVTWSIPRTDLTVVSKIADASMKTFRIETAAAPN